MGRQPVPTQSEDELELARHHAAVRAQVMREYVRPDDAPSGQPATLEIEQRVASEIARAEAAVARARAAQAAIPDRQEAAQRAMAQAVTSAEIRDAMRASVDAETDALASTRALAKAEADLVAVHARVHAEVIAALRLGATKAAEREHEAAIRMRDAVAERQRWRHAAQRLLGPAQTIVPASKWINEFGESSAQLTTKFTLLYGK